MQVYLHIYKTYNTNTTLLSCRGMALKWRRTDVYVTYVASTSFWRHVPAGYDQDIGVKSCPTLQMKSTVFNKVYF